MDRQIGDLYGIAFLLPRDHPIAHLTVTKRNKKLNS